MGTKPIRHLSDLPCARDWELDDLGWSTHAWMSDVDLKIIESALTRLTAELRRRLYCFEWGSGRSTLHCSGQLRDAGALAGWVSAEYNRQWFEKFSFEAGMGTDYHVHPMETGAAPVIPFDGGTHFLIFDYGELLPMKRRYAQHRFVPMKDYVNSIGLFPAQFDFVLVDGRKRNQCMFAASQKLAERGILFLHDAWRPYYSLGTTFFRTALRAGDNLMVASNLGLSELLNFVDLSDLCTENQILWCTQS